MEPLDCCSLDLFSRVMVSKRKNVPKKAGAKKKADGEHEVMDEDVIRNPWKASSYIAIARPDHWFKNIFMLPGLLLGLVLGDGGGVAVHTLALGFVAVCAIASANYTINEWLDREFDRHHPVKRNRPSANDAVRARGVYFQWAALGALGLAISCAINVNFFLANAFLLVMGVLYNVEPLRTKDKVFLDVLSESVNNPIRFLLGWYLIGAVAIPPSSILVAYWMGGAYLMAIKRFAEYRFIGDPAVAGNYRASFGRYTENSLLVSAFIYAMISATLLGVFLVKYKIEFVLSLPLFSILFGWYLHIGLKSDSVSQSPERLYREPAFVAYTVCMSIFVAALFFLDVPALGVLLERAVGVPE